MTTGTIGLPVTEPGARPSLRRRRRRLPAGPAQVAVWLVVAVLVLAPIAPLVYASIRSKPYYLPGGTFTLEPYRTLFADPAFWRAALNTALFATMTTTLAVGVGTLLAVLCNRTNMPGSHVFGLLLLAPIVIPPLGLIVGWVAIYGRSGYLTSVAGQRLHLPVWDLSSLPGMSVLGAAVSIPIVFLTCRAALSGTDSALEDAARACGASPLRVIRQIILPMLRPAILNCTLLIFALSLEVLGLPLFLGAPANIDFYASYLYHTWSNSIIPDPPQVSAGAVLLLIVVTALLAARSRLLGAEQRFISAGPRGGGSRHPLDLHPWRWPLALLVGGFITVTSAIPLAGLGLMSSVRVLTTLQPPWQLLTTASWHRIVTDPAMYRAITNSLLIAVVGSIAGVALAAVATVIAHRSGFALRRTVGPMLTYPRAVPGIILGIGFFWLLLMAGPAFAPVRNSIWGELLALGVHNITLAYIVIYPALARINTEFDKAARAAGAGWWTTVRTILLPLLRPALIAALLLMFISLLNDYDPVVFLQKPGTEVIGVTMLQSWDRGVTGPVAALAVIQVAIVGVVLALGARAARRGNHA